MELPDPGTTAQEILKKAGFASPPVNLEAISRLWPNLTIATENLDSEGYIVNFGALGSEIIVRSEDVPCRQRYSIAHELGHWVLNQSEYRHVDKEPNQATHPVIERWCDRFAACLLMPQEWVLRDLDNVGVNGIVNAVLNFPNRYQVSHRAFRLRISEVTSVSVFELVQRKSGTIVVQRRYESSSIGKSDLAITLRRITTLICRKSVPSTYLHNDTGLVSLHKPNMANLDNRKWLVCILPNALKKNPSTDAVSRYTSSYSRHN